VDHIEQARLGALRLTTIGRKSGIRSVLSHLKAEAERRAATA
jgi:hypothetical protein